MALAFRKARYTAPHACFEGDFSLPNGAVVGVTGSDPAELELFAELADGRREPDEGLVEHAGAHLAASTFSQIEPARARRAVEAAFDSDAETILLGPGVALSSPLFVARVVERIFQLRQAGRLVVAVSYDLAFLERIADEILVIDGGRVDDRGDPAATLRAYRRRLAERLRREAPTASLEKTFSRRGDGRARLVELDLTGEDDVSTRRLRSGECAVVRVRVRFDQSVEAPVIGMLLRNRVGVTVYGTNTELEGLRFGPCASGDVIELRFEFRCDLCPQEYTLTAASHDPDGTAHDWLEEALLFSVVDERETAGVANLRAKVAIELERTGTER